MASKIKIEKMSTVCDPLLEEDIGVLDKQQIDDVRIVESINDKNCVIINEANYDRNNYLFIPALIGALLSLFLFIGDYVKNWTGNERFYLGMVTTLKDRYGDEFYLNPRLPEYLKPYEYIANSKSISLPEYFYIRYMDSGFYDKSKVRHDLLGDGFFFLLFLTANSFLLYKLFFRLKFSPFVIDREKQVFYTWEKGRMYIARYTQLEVVHEEGILLLKTYGFDESDNLIYHRFKPRIFSIYNGRAAKVHLLTFMAKYLIQGKESVCSVDYQRQRTLFATLFTLRQEPKPADWEAQIEDILPKLDKVMPPERSSNKDISENEI